jgi:hypothetical protein
MKRLFLPVFITALVPLSMAIALACGDDDDAGGGDEEASPGNGDLSLEAIAGTYNCGLEEESEQPEEVWELRDDGALTVTPRRSDIEPVEGTWSVEEDQVRIQFDGTDDRFNVEGDSLIFAGEPGPEGTWTCTRER